ncbi:hypothetical protein NDU88_003588 [Pleurodeles waltl]|uniref:Secreted protein n=1 Tax=Pleurodeles waltl TaxID=8319 RepID=A0AAV7M7G9_PLEWA|nr:hypothetical protein NDU88_003588 [Pleurodeles waltl]
MRSEAATLGIISILTALLRMTDSLTEAGGVPWGIQFPLRGSPWEHTALKTRHSCQGLLLKYSVIRRPPGDVGGMQLQERRRVPRPLSIHSSNSWSDASLLISSVLSSNRGSAPVIGLLSLIHASDELFPP